MHRGDSKICRPTADRHSTCSVLNKTKTAPPVHGADGTQSIRSGFLLLFPCPDFLIVLLPGAHSNTANRRCCCPNLGQNCGRCCYHPGVAVVGPRAHNRVAKVARTEEQSSPSAAQNRRHALMELPVYANNPMSAI